MSRVQPTRIPPECLDTMVFFTSPKMVESSTPFLPSLVNPSGIVDLCPSETTRLHLDRMDHLPSLLMKFYLGQRTGRQSQCLALHASGGGKFCSWAGAWGGTCLLSPHQRLPCPPGCTSVLLGAKPKFPVSSPPYSFDRKLYAVAAHSLRNA